MYTFIFGAKFLHFQKCLMIIHVVYVSKKVLYIYLHASLSRCKRISFRKKHKIKKTFSNIFYNEKKKKKMIY